MKTVLLVAVVLMILGCSSIPADKIFSKDGHSIFSPRQRFIFADGWEGR